MGRFDVGDQSAASGLALWFAALTSVLSQSRRQSGTDVLPGGIGGVSLAAVLGLVDLGERV